MGRVRKRQVKLNPALVQVNLPINLRNYFTKRFDKSVLIGVEGLTTNGYASVRPEPVEGRDPTISAVFE